MSNYFDVRQKLGALGYVNDKVIKELTYKLIDVGCPPDDIIDALNSSNPASELSDLKRKYIF